MTRAEREAFLREPRPAILSVPQPGRAPLSTPVWYDFAQGGNFWVLMQRDSRKGQLLEVGTCVSLCVQQDTRPYRYATVEGPVVGIAAYGLEADLLPMAVRYLGMIDGPAYTERMRERVSRGQGIRVEIAPEHWLSADYDES